MIVKKGIRAFVLLASFACTSVFADVAEAMFMPQGAEQYPKVSPKQVEIFVYKPDFKFKIIGTIEARGMAGEAPGAFDSIDITTYFRRQPTEKDDMQLAIKALKEEAGKSGATGVIIMRSQQVQVSNDGSTERRIHAIAIIRD